MGIISKIVLEKETFLIAITKALLVYTISKNDLYKVLDTHFFKLNEEVEKSNDSNERCYNNNDSEIIIQLKEIFKNRFYIFNIYDFANSFT